jgi:hypothetical protein
MVHRWMECFEAPRPPSLLRTCDLCELTEFLDITLARTVTKVSIIDKWRSRTSEVQWNIVSAFGNRGF